MNTFMYLGTIGSTREDYGLPLQKSKHLSAKDRCFLLYTSVAQWIEHGTSNPSVEGSTPSRRANVFLAQLDRASDYGSEGRGFESFRGRQMVFECNVVSSLTVNQVLEGADPFDHPKL
jgi:hypothetical protein